MKTKMTILRDTISNVISSMCFMFEDTEPKEKTEAIDYQISAEDDFFDLEMFIGKDIALEMTSNLLGSTEEINEEEITDCLKEIVNTIIGQFISKNHDNHPPLLPIPKAKKTNSIQKKYHLYEKETLYYTNKPCIILYRDKTNE